MILLDTDTISLLAAGHARVAARFISSTEPVAHTSGVFTGLYPSLFSTAIQTQGIYIPRSPDAVCDSCFVRGAVCE